jgi:ethanolamine utilization microcompartment shell protein EutS
MASINLGRIGMVVKGPWNSTFTYDRLDVVSYQGGGYVALDTNTNKAPDTNTAYWLQIAEPGKTGSIDNLEDWHITGALGYTPADQAVVNSHLAEKASQIELGHIKLQEPWKDAVLQNGWTGTLQYAKNDLGQLVIKGLIKGGTMSPNTIITTLPSGYHTNYRAILMAQVIQSASGVPLLYMNNANGYLRLTANHGVVADEDCHIFAILDIN